MISQPVNPLANPKGVKLSCELCGNVATVQCGGCRATYYCSKEHQEEDWKGIHMKICAMVGPLRTQTSVLGSEEERARRKKATRETQQTLIDLTRQEALKLLNDGQFGLAIPAALQTLKLSLDVHGPGSLELVPAYLLLGESSTGLGKHGQAETYLSSAKWAVIKNPEACPASIRASLHRNFGKLYAAMAKSAESEAQAEEFQDLALQHFASDVYHSSLDKGPLSFEACGGYFQLGCMLFAKGAGEKALAMFELAADITLEAIRKGIESAEAASAAAAAMAAGAPAGKQAQQQQQQQQAAEAAQQFAMSPAAQSECFHMLTTIAEARDQLLGAMSEGTAVALLGVGMCHLLGGSLKKAESTLTHAYERLSDTAGPGNEKTEMALKYLNKATQKGLMGTSSRASTAQGSTTGTL